MKHRMCQRTMPFSGEQALGRYRQGDDRAMGEMIREYEPMMRAVARRYLVSGSDVDDAVQDAWTSFVRAEGTIAHPERLAGWLCVTSARAALGIAKRQRRCEPTDQERLTSMVCAWTDDLEGIDGAHRRRLVRRALARLNPRDLLLIELLMGDDELSYAVVSARVGCPIGSIGPTRRRALAKLGREPEIRELAESA